MQPDPPMIELPPLPGSDALPFIGNARMNCWFAESVRSYGEACARAALEAAAQTLWDASQPLIQARRPNQVDRHVADVLQRHAESIRALKVTP
jgi:hypothetical protein